MYKLIFCPQALIFHNEFIRIEWYGQFKSAIDSQLLTDDVKLTYIKTLVTGKAKIAIAEFAYFGLMEKDALRT